MHEQIKTLHAPVAFTREALSQTVPPWQPHMPANIQRSVGAFVPSKSRSAQSSKATICNAIRGFNVTRMKQMLGKNQSAKGRHRNEQLQPEHAEAWQVSAIGHFLCLCRNRQTINVEFTSFKSSLSSPTATSNLVLFSANSSLKSKAEGTKRALAPPQNFVNNFSEVSQQAPRRSVFILSMSLGTFLTVTRIV